MKRQLATTAASAAGLILLALASSPSLAASGDDAATSMRLAHMSQGQTGGQDGPGMMGPKMGGRGMMGGGAMGPGMMGPGMMGPGMMGPGMMGPGMMPMMQQMHRDTKGQGMMGPGHGSRVVPQQDLSSDDVRHFLEHHLAMQGNPRLKVGEINEKDDDTVVADIVTTDGALVDRFEVDRHTGQMKRVN